MKFLLAVLSFMLIIGSASFVQGVPCPEAIEQLGNAPDVTTWPPAPYRWKDIMASRGSKAPNVWATLPSSS